VNLPRVEPVEYRGELGSRTKEFKDSSALEPRQDAVPVESNGEHSARHGRQHGPRDCRDGVDIVVDHEMKVW
jgi:hypothetical protein